MEIEKTCVIETVIFYVDPKSVGPLNFLGKERIQFSVTNEHFLLTVFKKQVSRICRIEGRGRETWLSGFMYPSPRCAICNMQSTLDSFFATFLCKRAV